MPPHIEEAFLILAETAARKELKKKEVARIIILKEKIENSLKSYSNSNIDVCSLLQKEKFDKLDDEDKRKMETFITDEFEPILQDLEVSCEQLKNCNNLDKVLSLIKESKVSFDSERLLGHGNHDKLKTLFPPYEQIVKCCEGIPLKSVTRSIAALQRDVAVVLFLQNLNEFLRDKKGKVVFVCGQDSQFYHIVTTLTKTKDKYVADWVKPLVWHVNTKELLILLRKKYAGKVEETEQWVKKAIEIMEQVKNALMKQNSECVSLREEVFENLSKEWIEHCNCINLIDAKKDINNLLRDLNVDEKSTPKEATLRKYFLLF